MTPNDQKNQARAVLLSAACGDALGWPTEFSRWKEIRARFGDKGITEMPVPALVTDDTQMSVAVAEGLLDAARVGLDLSDAALVMPLVAKRFANWSVSLENTRAPGNTCMAACGNLVRGVPWQKAGVKDSRGCGAVMRVAPIGILYDDPDALGVIAEASATVTHDSDVGRQAAHLGAFAVRYLLAESDPKHLVRDLFRVIPKDRLDLRLRCVLERVDGAVDATMAGRRTPQTIMVNVNEHSDALGLSWHADEALASALYCFLLAVRRGEGVVETIRYGANTDGDSDSIAAISGSCAGAHWGLDGAHGLPRAWYERVEGSARLIELADQLVAARFSCARS